MENDSETKSGRGERILAHLRNPNPVYVTWFQIGAAFVTISMGLGALTGYVTSGAGEILAVGICILFSISILLLVLKDYWHSQELDQFSQKIEKNLRKARYADASAIMHNAFHKLRDAWYSRREDDNLNTVKNQIKESLCEFAAAFSLITGAPCRVCVKMSYLVDPTSSTSRGWAVKTFLRSEDVEERTHKSGCDWVDQNSDFEELMRADHEPKSRRFFHNSLPYFGYKNSHYTEEEMERGDLPYSSTIVWPIRKKFDQESSDIPAFLCIDSKMKDVFKEEYDVDFGATYADVLCVILKPILEKEESKK